VTTSSSPASAKLSPKRERVTPGLLRDHPRPQQLLADLGALLAVGLCLTEEFGELTVATALGIGDERLEPENIIQATLGEPDQVVVLVSRAGHVTRFGGMSHALSRFLLDGRT